LLVRRHRERRDERAYYLCRGPADTPWKELVRVAGSNWAVEEGFERAKGECGLAASEVRSWVGWHRHVTLSMFALAMLSVIRSRAASRPSRREKGARG
jgi:SRSO17 transposase